mmetsp:Transcript_24919/g.63212  ORF Transcript_24919/g.63212 Transcript_24919/m.63212 type:complete len:264 (+) Transcript_24919:203-994(+)
MTAHLPCSGSSPPSFHLPGDRYTDSALTASHKYSPSMTSVRWSSGAAGCSLATRPSAGSSAPVPAALRHTLVRRGGPYTNLSVAPAYTWFTYSSTGYEPGARGGVNTSSEVAVREPGTMGVMAPPISTRLVPSFAVHRLVARSVMRLVLLVGTWVAGLMERRVGKKVAGSALDLYPFTCATNSALMPGRVGGYWHTTTSYVALSGSMMHGLPARVTVMGVVVAGGCSGHRLAPCRRTRPPLTSRVGTGRCVTASSTACRIGAP